MVDDSRRPSRLSGLWVLLVGGSLIGLLVVLLDPVTRREDCPNWGANGDSSAFRNSAWDLYLPLLTFVWWVLVIIEQMLPVTHRHRGTLGNAVRAIAAVVLSTIGLCFGVLPLDLVCRA